MTEPLKTCRKCGIKKPTTEFGIRGSRGKRYLAAWCRLCEREDQRARYSPERARQYRANRYAKDPHYKARQHLSHNYGITLEEYERILAGQRGRCAVCGSDDPRNRKSAPRFHIDHCHSTGEIRGLLCSNCNAGIGRFKDNPEWLEKAASYLRWSRTGLRAKRTYRYGRQSGYVLHD